VGFPASLHSRQVSTGGDEKRIVTSQTVSEREITTVAITIISIEAGAAPVLHVATRIENLVYNTRQGLVKKGETRWHKARVSSLMDARCSAISGLPPS
jgi:hypothetical protein